MEAVFTLSAFNETISHPTAIFSLTLLLFCINWILVRLACPGTSTSINSAYAFTTLAIYALHWFFVVWTYMNMVRTCLRSKKDRAKFMQTCTPHLIQLLTFFVIVVSDFMHMRYPSKSPKSFQNFVAIAVVFVTPLVNPLLYGFKLTKIRQRIIVLIQMRRKR
ncbi:unnamed protein product [Menidia menidia]|uniref:(Atlantic silverside) hypothetical protein n=1 Tax=Menidia menidia TaxID=238744 RepID=A0A8S4AF60_9TELE|nr:unnamed protein product [Menidia menidia]